MNNKKGFTLAELLIVVAIIAVLTAIALPIFATQLEHSREETDIANMRAGKAAAVAYFLENTGSGANNTVWFNAQTGDVQENSNSISGYGRGTQTDGRSDPYPEYNNTTDYTNQIVHFTRNISGGVETITAAWN